MKPGATAFTVIPYGPSSRATAQKIGALAMLGRTGEPDDVANAVAFFASPDAGWVTAQVLAVDGGRMDYIGR